MLTETTGIKNEISFANTQRRRARIETQTPMRVALGGGGTDLPWYALNEKEGAGRGGAWISCAIDRFLTVHLNMTEDPSFLRVSYGDDLSYQGEDFRQIKNPIIRSCVEKAGVACGIELSIASEASGRSGLGGSGALEVGTLNALYAFKKEPVSQLQLAREAYEIESRQLGRPIGPHDQYIVALGGIKYFEMDPEGIVQVEDLGCYLNRETVARLHGNLLYFATGIKRDAAEVLSAQKVALVNDGYISEGMIKSYDEIKAIGQEARRSLLEGRMDDFGRSFYDHWLVKQRLSSNMSNPDIDNYLEEAMKAGALGGKIIGAGGGGWLVFYVKESCQAGFRNRMLQLGILERDVLIDWEGTKVVRNDS